MLVSHGLLMLRTHTEAHACRASRRGSYCSRSRRWQPSSTATTVQVGGNAQRRELLCGGLLFAGLDC